MSARFLERKDGNGLVSALVAVLLSATLLLLMLAPIVGVVSRRTRGRAAVVFDAVIRTRGRARVVFDAVIPTRSRAAAVFDAVRTRSIVYRSATVVGRILMRHGSVDVAAAVRTRNLVVHGSMIGFAI